MRGIQPVNIGGLDCVTQLKVNSPFSLFLYSNQLVNVSIYPSINQSQISLLVFIMRWPFHLIPTLVLRSSPNPTGSKRLVLATLTLEIAASFVIPFFLNAQSNQLHFYWEFSFFVWNSCLLSWFPRSLRAKIGSSPSLTPTAWHGV